MDLSNLLNGNQSKPADSTTNPTAVPEPVAEPVVPSPAAVEPVVTPVEPVSKPELPTAMPTIPEPVVQPAAVEPVVTPIEPVVPTTTGPQPVVAPVEPVVPEMPTPEPVSSIPEPVAPLPAVEPVVTPVEPISAAASVAAVSPGGEVFEGVGSGKYKVVVLKDKCIGAASCVAVSPKTFELNDQQIAKVLPTVKTETDENLLLAAQSCPTLAIEVYDTVSGEKVWPK